MQSRGAPGVPSLFLLVFKRCSRRPGMGESGGAQWSRGARSCKQQCLIRRQDYKYEDFDPAPGCGIPHQAAPGLGCPVSRGDAGCCFLLARVRRRGGLLVSGADRESRKGSRLISRAGLRPKESGKMVRAIKEERTCVEREERLQPAAVAEAGVGGQVPAFRQRGLVKTTRI